MALIVKKSDEPRIVRNWPVVVSTALDDGKTRKDEIFVDFEVIKQTELDDIQRSAQQAGEVSDPHVLRRVVKAINGMVDDANNPLAFEEAFERMLSETNIRIAAAGSVYDVQAGRKPARKN